MRTVAISLALGLGLVVFGASGANADDNCIQFRDFCDCLDVKGKLEEDRSGRPRPLFGTWVNQDCAETSSLMQGGAGTFSMMQGIDLEVSFFSGEKNPRLNQIGRNWSFTFVDLLEKCTFDLHVLGRCRGKPPIKCRLRIQKNELCRVVPGECPADCSAASDLPSSKTKENP